MDLDQALRIDDQIQPLRDRDRVLMAELSDVLASHVFLRELTLPFVISGGVVHLRGRVPSEEVRSLVRRVIGRLRGIHAVWDTLLIEGETSLKIIDIGSGGHKQIPWATGVDRRPLPGVDLVADLEAGIPFQNDEIDHVYAVHFLEHVRDLVSLMNEIHRCLKRSGVLHIMVPNCESPNAIADPTHVRLFNDRTFRYFCTSAPGVMPFRPLIVSQDHDNILADLQPVKGNESSPAHPELSMYFD
jgi:SAM-dependent methyltransferase